MLPAGCRQLQAGSLRSPEMLRDGRESWLDAETGDEFLAGGDLLNPFFVLKGTLFVMVGQAPARFDTKKRSAIGPQC
jgi:hypothetical protein